MCRLAWIMYVVSLRYHVLWTRVNPADISETGEVLDEPE